MPSRQGLCTVLVESKVKPSAITWNNGRSMVVEWDREW